MINALADQPNCYHRKAVANLLNLIQRLVYLFFEAPTACSRQLTPNTVHPTRSLNTRWTMKFAWVESNRGCNAWERRMGRYDEGVWRDE